MKPPETISRPAKGKPSSPVRFGVIGLGNMGISHARMLGSGTISRAILSAVCDTASERTEQMPGVPAFGDSEALIDSGLVDAVVIATPHFSHTGIGVRALDAGLHVLMEKPIAVHKLEAERLIEAYRNPRQVFGAMFNQRSDPHFQTVRRLVKSGELGAIHRIHWAVTDWFRSEAYYRSSDWRATWAGEGGGVLLNQCVHNLDLLQWIFGLPVRVKSFCQLGRFHDIEVEDHVTALFEYADGALATFATSTGEAPGSNRLEISAERGRVVLENHKLVWDRNEVPASEFSRSTPEAYVRPQHWRVEIPLPDHRGGQHREILENFTSAILDGTPLLAPGVEGLNAVELSNAILWASLSDQTITLPMDGAAFAEVLNRLIADSKPREGPTSSRAAWTRSHDFGPASSTRKHP